MGARIGVLLYDDLEPIDVGGTFGVLSMARRIVPGLALTTVAQVAGPVRLANGLSVAAEHGFADCGELDALIVPGGSGWQDQADDERTLEFLHTMHSTTLLVSVCTGAMILAAAGLLDGRAATTRRQAVGTERTPLESLGHSGTIDAVEAPYVDSGDIITGGGVTLSIDTTLYLLDRLFGAKVGDEVARLIDYATARRANHAAFDSP